MGESNGSGRNTGSDGLAKFVISPNKVLGLKDTLPESGSGLILVDFFQA